MVPPDQAPLARMKGNSAIKVFISLIGSYVSLLIGVSTVKQIILSFEYNISTAFCVCTIEHLLLLCFLVVLS